MTGSYLINGPRSLPYAVTAAKIQVFDDILNANSKPASLVAWLFLYSHSKLVIEFSQWFIQQSYRIRPCALNPFDELLILPNF